MNGKLLNSWSVDLPVSRVMEQQRDLLSALLSNRLDRVKVIHNLLRLKQSVDEDAPFIILKYQLQLELIQILLKQSSQDDLYLSSLKKETISYLDFHHKKHTQTGYSCCLAGCLYRTGRHRYYLRHLKQSHANASNVSCQFGLQCGRAFSSVDLLFDHFEQVHQKTCRTVPGAPAPAEVPCKCSVIKCSGREFTNTRNLMLHLRKDHVGETIKCIFVDCEKQLDNSESLRKHFYVKHIKLNHLNLKDVHKVHPKAIIHDDEDLCTNTCDELAIDVDMEEHITIDEELEEYGGETMDEAVDENLDKYFMMSFCDFLNRLSNFQFVPQSTIQIIANEYLKNYQKSNQVKLKSLSKQLQKSSGLSDMDKEKILEAFEGEDDFLAAQLSLDTEYKRKQFLKDNFTYVPPEEIILNAKEMKESGASKDVMHYVSVVDNFKNLIQDSSFLAMEERNVIPESESLIDVKDGEYYKQNPFFQQNPRAYTMMIYSDAIELVNPLGAGRGKHKVIQIFFSLCEISKHLRSRIDRIQLVAVFKEKLIKKHGFKKIYKRLVKDLKILEDGVVVDYPVKRTVKCGVLIHPCDNLEAHTVGGFSQSFSSKDICRWCHIQHSDLVDRIHDFGEHPHAKWTAMEYDRAALAAEKKIQASSENLSEEESNDDATASSDEDVDSSDEDFDPTDDTSTGDPSSDEEIESGLMFGVKHECPLNCLDAFHSIGGFPPDCLHDLLEGVVSQDLLGVIRILSSKKWFTVDEYNKSLKSLKYKFYEASDRPVEVPISSKVRKLKGKAVSIWTHMRNFPLIVRQFVKHQDDPVLALGLQLHEITERIFAQKFEHYEIQVLEERITSFLDCRKDVFNDYPVLGTPKPKTHFLSHYPDAIRLYGPPLSYWTARYESRHRIAKMTSESAKNFVNISCTVATRQQMRQSSVVYHGLFPTSDLVISDKATFKEEIKASSADFERAIVPFMSDNDFLCSEIEFRCQTYKSGQLVVLEVCNPDELKVGLILSILVKEKSTQFVTKQYFASRTALQYFKAESKEPTTAFHDASKLADFKPLINHGTSSQLFFSLHHHISYSYP